MNTCQQPQPYDKMYLSTILYMNYIGLIQQSIFQLPAVDIQISIDLCVCVMLGCREEYDEDILVMSCRFVNCCLLRQSSFSLLSTPSNAMNEWWRTPCMPQQQRIIRSHLLSFSFVLITLIIMCPFPSPFYVCSLITIHCVSVPISFLSHMYLLLFILCLW